MAIVDPLEAVATQNGRHDRLPDSELHRQVGLLGPRWSISEGELRLELSGAMTRTAAAAAVAGELADRLDHHPRIVIEYAGLTLTIHTHDAKAITALDLVFAARLEQWLRSHGWS